MLTKDSFLARGRHLVNKDAHVPRPSLGLMPHSISQHSLLLRQTLAGSKGSLPPMRETWSEFLAQAPAQSWSFQASGGLSQQVSSELSLSTFPIIIVTPHGSSQDKWLWVDDESPLKDSILRHR